MKCSSLASGAVRLGLVLSATSLLAAQSVQGDRTRRLNAPLVSQEIVDAFALSPDGAWAVYRSGERLTSVPLTASGGPRVLASSGAGGSFVVSPDSARVFFQDAAEHTLRMVPLDGSASPTTLGFDFVTSIAGVAPDGSRLIMRTLDGLGSSEVTSIDLATLSSTFVSFGVAGLEFTTDSSTIAYGVEEFFTGTTTLFAEPATGLGDEDLLETGLVCFGPLDLTPDGALAVYRACDETTGFRSSLRSVPLDGSGPVTIVADPNAGAFLVGEEFTLTTDGTRAVFSGDLAVSGRIDLWVVPVDGSAPPVQLNAPQFPGADVALDASMSGTPFRITPDDQRVVYAGDQEVDGLTELYSAPLDASAAPTKLNPTFGTGSGLVVDALGPQLELTPDGARVVFRAEDVSGRFELLSAPVDGSAPAVRLHAPLSATQDVRMFFACLPDSSGVVFVADLLQDGQDELWLAPVDGSAPPVRRSGPLLQAGADVLLDFEVSADGRFAVFRSDRVLDGVVELWSHPIELAPRSQPSRQRHP